VFDQLKVFHAFAVFYNIVIETTKRFSN